MSKRRCTALETLLTFCPPAPCARTAVSSISLSGTTNAYMAAILPRLAAAVRLRYARQRGGNPWTRRRPRLLFPALQPLYLSLEPLSWPLIALRLRVILAVHGWGKIAARRGGHGARVRETGLRAPGRAHLPADPGRVRRRYRDRGRPVHALLRRRGDDRDGGHHLRALPAERLLLAQPRLRVHAAVGLVALAIWVRGGGPYSLDRRIGVEL